MVLPKEISFPNPVVVFAEHPYVYTGTDYKLRNVTNTWKALVAKNSWAKAASKLKVSPQYIVPRQIAVPAEEPDHLLQQEDLVLGKTTNQIIALMHALENFSGKAEHDVIIPAEIYEMYAQGYLSLAFINTDVGNMHRIGRGKYYPLRNFYANRNFLSLNSEAKLARRLDSYWTEVYPAKGGAYNRAIESGTTLTQVVWEREYGSEYGSRTFAGVSTVGLIVEKSILSTKKGRCNAIGYLHEKYKGSDKHLGNGHNPLAELVGRAGGMKAEDYFALAESLGVYAEIIAHGSDEASIMKSLMEHVEGPPIALVQQLVLTLANTSDCELHNVDGVRDSGPRIYPPGMRDLLSL